MTAGHPTGQKQRRDYIDHRPVRYCLRMGHSNRGDGGGLIGLRIGAKVVLADGVLNMRKGAASLAAVAGQTGWLEHGPAAEAHQDRKLISVRKSLKLLHIRNNQTRGFPRHAQLC